MIQCLGGKKANTDIMMMGPHTDPLADPSSAHFAATQLKAQPVTFSVVFFFSSGPSYLPTLTTSRSRLCLLCTVLCHGPSLVRVMCVREKSTHYARAPENKMGGRGIMYAEYTVRHRAVAGIIRSRKQEDRRDANTSRPVAVFLFPCLTSTHQMLCRTHTGERFPTSFQLQHPSQAAASSLPKQLPGLARLFSLAGSPSFDGAEGEGSARTPKNAQADVRVQVRNAFSNGPAAPERHASSEKAAPGLATTLAVARQGARRGKPDDTVR